MIMSANDAPVDWDFEARLAAAAADRCRHCGSPRADDPAIPALPARYRLLPLDAAPPPPEVDARLRELGAAPYLPWIWLRTVAPLDPGQPVRLLAEGACLTHAEYGGQLFQHDRWRGYTLDLFGMHFVEPDALPPDCEAWWIDAHV